MCLSALRCQQRQAQLPKGRPLGTGADSTGEAHGAQRHTHKVTHFITIMEMTLMLSAYVTIFPQFISGLHGVLTNYVSSHSFSHSFIRQTSTENQLCGQIIVLFNSRAIIPITVYAMVVQTW